MTRRILYLIETLGHGGAEHQLVETLKLLDRSLFEPTVCHFRAPSYLAAELKRHDIRVICLNAPAGKRSWPTIARQVARHARALDVDLIHTSLLEADVLGGIAGRLTGIPVVSTLCNIAGEKVRLVDNPHVNLLKLNLLNLVWSNTLRHLHRHSIAISQAVRLSAASVFGLDPGRISVIYRGIESSRRVSTDAREQLRHRLGFESAEPLLLSIGRLAPQKGHRYLLTAMARVVGEFPRARLAIVGEGWLRAELERLAAELGVADNVTFLGKRTDVPELLRACDVFVFPSLFEGLGVSLLEASYAGCASISTNTGPIPEVIDDGASGLLVPPADSDALAAAILRLARAPELRAQLGEAARAKALAQFMLTDKVEELQLLYGSVLALT